MSAAEMRIKNIWNNAEFDEKTLFRLVSSLNYNIMHITLLGHMGCGKTTQGKKLAHGLSIPFYDLDSVIEERYKIKVFDIFQKYGEACFRILERETLSFLLNENENTIVSLGGGTPCFYDNIELINKKSKSVYIQMSAKSLCYRLLASKTKRPLIANLNKKQLLEFIETQLCKREKYYFKADVVVKGESIVPSKLLEIVMQLWNNN